MALELKTCKYYKPLFCKFKNCSLFQYRYNKLSRHVRTLANKIKQLDSKDPFRNQCTNQILNKLWVQSASLPSDFKINKRRTHIELYMKYNKWCENCIMLSLSKISYSMKISIFQKCDIKQTGVKHCVVRLKCICLYMY